MDLAVYPKIKKNLNTIVACTIALLLSFWCLGKHLPGLPFGAFFLGVLLIFYLSPLIAKNGILTLPHKYFFLFYVVVHLLAFMMNLQSLIALEFFIKVLISVVFFLLMVNLLHSMQEYEKTIFCFMMFFGVLVLYLVYTHLIVYKNIYLSAHMGGTEELTRAGKNTLSFLLGVVFPFYMARFIYKKTILSFLLFGLIGFAMFYTLSRMVILSFFVSFVLFCITSLKRKSFIKLAVYFLVLAIIGSAVTGVGVMTFKKLRSPANIAEIERGEKKLINFEGHRVKLIQAGIYGFMDSPIWGNGLASFRTQEKYTGGSLSHNDYIQIIYEMGLLGVASVLGLFFLSVIDLWRARKRIEERYYWLLDAQLVSITVSFFMLLFINAYETVVVWFILAGAQIINICTRRDEKLVLKTKENPHAAVTV